MGPSLAVQPDQEDDGFSRGQWLLSLSPPFFSFLFHSVRFLPHFGGNNQKPTMSVQPREDHHAESPQEQVVPVGGDEYELQETPLPRLDISPAPTPSSSLQRPLQSLDATENTENVSLLPSSSDSSSPRPASIQSTPEQIPTTAPKVHQRLWRSTQRRWRNTWVPEILGILLAVASLFAILAVLNNQDGKTTSQWPIRISINAVIAIFVVLLKAGLALPLSEGKIV